MSDTTDPTDSTDPTESTKSTDSNRSTQTPSSEEFPIVGIGASAGGLAAFEAFFSGMPDPRGLGMAFVLVQHLAPNHKSILAELIRRYTEMQVFVVEDGMEVRPGCVYIISPGHDLSLSGRTLHLSTAKAIDGHRLPIDSFFQSLAAAAGPNATCIVLSGTGSDGSEGVRAIAKAGGCVMAQTPESTEYNGMPKAAIATGKVDFVLHPAEMAAQLASQMAGVSPATGPDEAPNVDPPLEALAEISAILEQQTGHDFSGYKHNTLVRRIERRLAHHRFATIEDYIAYLSATPDEAQALFRDLLISVTEFFRDPDVFATLKSDIVSELFAAKPKGAPIRVWVCGCASGEEAYSIAMVLLEHIETLDKAVRIQIFATDIDRSAIARARAGVYDAASLAKVSAERVARFFTHDAGTNDYRIRKSIRDLVIFSEQDVIKDPPFSKIDFISCRNLLIYLNAALQKKLLPVFHYALNPGGVLLLGSSETIGEFTSLFQVIDSKKKLYRSQPGSGRVTGVVFGGRSLRMPAERISAASLGDGRRGDRNRESLREVVEHTLVAHFGLPAALVDASGEVIYVHGHTGRFLEPAVGHANLNLLAMARGGLRPALTSALYRATTQPGPVRVKGIRVDASEEKILVSVTVRKAERRSDAVAADLFLVLFEEEAAPLPLPVPGATLAADGEPTNGTLAIEEIRRIAVLEAAMQTKEEFLQNSIEQMDTANEELRSTIEEMQSVNEELQSTNEELETSKEELQSLNEELATVNSELQHKVADLSRVKNDMNNLLAGTGIGTLFLDHELRITRFTPAVTEVINLIPGDRGRPIGDIANKLVDYADLVADVQAVLDDLVPRVTEAQTKSGAWFQIRIRPYRTLENVIEGAVLTLVNVTDHRRLLVGLAAAQHFSDAIIATVRESLLVLDPTLRVLRVNAAFCRTFAVAEESVKGKLVYELADERWNNPALRTLLEDILPKQETIEDHQVEVEMPNGERQTMRINARRLAGGSTGDASILMAIEAVGERP